MHAAEPCQAESRAVLRVTTNRLFEQSQRLSYLPVGGRIHRKGAQIGVVGGEIARRAAGRRGGFGGLQRWLDDPGNRSRDLVLEVEHIFERAVEMVGPEMCPGFGLYQLRADANPVAD